MRLALAVLFVIAAVVPIEAQETPKSSADVRRERIDRVNKVWDAQIEKMRGAQIAAKCKAEAKKQYSAIHFKKRRMFVTKCIEQSRR
jgi:ABC-type sulfate transport system substrate-binding protein